MISVLTAAALAAGVGFACGVLIFAAVLGVRRRLQTNGQSNSPKDLKEKCALDMEWDNSEMNITINPLDSIRENLLPQDGASIKSQDEDAEATEMEWDDM